MEDYSCKVLNKLFENFVKVQKEAEVLPQLYEHHRQLNVLLEPHGEPEHDTVKNWYIIKP